MGCTGSKYQALGSEIADAPVDNGAKRDRGQEQGGTETGYAPAAAAAPADEPTPLTPKDGTPSPEFPDVSGVQNGRTSPENVQPSPSTEPAPTVMGSTWWGSSWTSSTASADAEANGSATPSPTSGDIEGLGVPAVPEEKDPAMAWSEVSETSWFGFGSSSPSKPAPPPPPMPPVRPPPTSPNGEPGSVLGFESTVIIFDWDDTLLCSSALHCCQSGQFAELEQIVESLLLIAMGLGRTIIVTNAMDSWIQETARQFMPRLLPLLARLLIVYARENHERLWPGDTFAWKREAFSELLRYWVGRDLNLVVLGDSLSEIRAAEAMANKLGSASAVKTVKFKALPSPSDLLGELRAISAELNTLVSEPKSATKELVYDGARRETFFMQGSKCWSLVDAVPNSFDHGLPGWHPGAFGMAAGGAGGPSPLWYTPQLPQAMISPMERGLGSNAGQPPPSPGISVGGVGSQDGREAYAADKNAEVSV